MENWVTVAIRGGGAQHLVPNRKGGAVSDLGFLRHCLLEP